MMERLRKIFGIRVESDNDSDIYGLESGVNANRRRDIPVTFMDNATEQQIFIAADLYKDKPILLRSVLQSLQQLLSNGECTKNDIALDIVLRALRKYLKEKQIQISGNVSLFYIVENDDRPLSLNDVKVKRRIIGLIKAGMDYHKYEHELLYYGCLVLCELKLDFDVTCEYKNLVKVSVHVLSANDHDEYIIKTGLYLLSLVSWQVNDSKRNSIGDAGAIKPLLALIKGRLDLKICDDILEGAWATLWNIVNNAQKNCERFLNEKGIECFIRCIDMFPEQDILTENMMGFLLCIAKIKKLRIRLLKNRLTSGFINELFLNQTEIELNCGYATEQQILSDVELYRNNPKLMGNVLNHTIHLFRNGYCTRLDQVLDIILDALNRHAKVTRVQHFGCALIAIIMNINGHPLLNDVTVKQRIITTILTGMDNHKTDSMIVYYGCLSLSKMRIDQDVMFEYKRLIKMAIHILSTSEYKGFVRNTCTNVLNLVISQLNNEQKNEIGDGGVIKKFKIIIKDRLCRKLCDDVLETAWSTILNLAEGVPKNFERFHNGNGMKFFFGCLKTFPDEEKLKFNMMDLMGNVAKVKYLRARLMQDKFIKAVFDLLVTSENTIRVNYNAALVLAHLASDGYKAWTISTPSRNDVLMGMTKASQNWNFNSYLIIDNRSIKPVLQLAQVRHTPECAQLAVWGLANLTKKMPEKYCSVVIAEGGLKIMNDLLKENYNMIHENSKAEVIHSLAIAVIIQCMAFMIKAREG